MERPLISLFCLLFVACGATDATPTPSASAFTILASDLPEALTCVQGVNASDVWAVGSDAGDGPLVLHYDGTSWERLNTGDHPGDLWWVHPTPDHVYMAGVGGRLLDLDRATGVLTPTEGPSAITFFGVWGTDGGTLWAVGGDISAEIPPAIWTRDPGEGWQPFVTAALAQEPPTSVLYKVHGSSADDVWIVGTPGLILHWDGQEMARISSPTTSPLFTVHTGGPFPVAVGGFRQAVILHREGDAWIDHSPAFQPQVNGIAGRGDLVVGVGTQGSVQRWDGASWVSDPSPLTPLDLHAVWLDEAGGIWTVGGSLDELPLESGVLAYSGSAAVPRVMEGP